MLRGPTNALLPKGWCLPLRRPGRTIARVSTTKGDDFLLAIHHRHRMYAAPLRVAPIVKRNTLSTTAAAKCVNSHQSSRLQATKATVVAHRLLAQSPTGRHFLPPFGTRGFSDRPENRLEPWIAHEIRECLRVARRYDLSLWRMALLLRLTSLSRHDESCYSDLKEFTKRLSGLRRSVTPQLNSWFMLETLYRVVMYKRSLVALHGILLTDAESCPSYLTPEERQDFAKLLDSEIQWRCFWLSLAITIELGILDAVVSWFFEIEGMGFIEIITSKPTEDIHKEHF